MNRLLIALVLLSVAGRAEEPKALGCADAKAAVAQGQASSPCQVRGVVIDSVGALVPTVAIHLLRGSHVDVISTGEDGQFCFETNQTAWTLKVVKRNFKSKSISSDKVALNKQGLLEVKLDLDEGQVQPTYIWDFASLVDITTSSVETRIVTGHQTIPSNPAPPQMDVSQVPLQRNVTSLFYTGAGVQ